MEGDSKHPEIVMLPVRKKYMNRGMFKLW